METLGAFQDTPSGRVEIESRYVIHDDGTIGFEVGEYDTSRVLVIDPILDLTSFVGGAGVRLPWIEEDCRSVECRETTGRRFRIESTIAASLPSR